MEDDLKFVCNLNLLLLLKPVFQIINVYNTTLIYLYIDQKTCYSMKRRLQWSALDFNEQYKVCPGWGFL